MKDIANRIYLDTNLILYWFELRFVNRNKEADELKIIKFLSKHKKDFEIYISMLSIIEIVARLRKNLKDKVSLEQIYIILEYLREMIGLTTILPEEYTDKKGTKWKGMIISQETIHFAFDCCDARDSIHIDIAKANELLFITRDTDASRVQKSYPHVIGAEKFMKQFDN